MVFKKLNAASHCEVAMETPVSSSKHNNPVFVHVDFAHARRDSMRIKMRLIRGIAGAKEQIQQTFTKVEERENRSTNIPVAAPK